MGHSVIVWHTLYNTFQIYFSFICVCVCVCVCLYIHMNADIGRYHKMASDPLELCLYR